MNNRLTAIAAAAIFCTFASTAYAQGSRDRQEQRQDRREDRREDRRDERNGEGVRLAAPEIDAAGATKGLVILIGALLLVGEGVRRRVKR